MRVWVARPEPGASRTGERLAALGHEPLVAPVLTTRPTGTPLPSGPFDAVLLTSAHGLDGLAPDVIAVLEGRPIFAVGPRTAQAAARRGLGPVIEGAGDAAGLVAAVATRLAPGAGLLHLAGADRKPEPAASLARAGYGVGVHVAYVADPVPALPAPVVAALAGRAPALAAALHYSRRSAATALDLVRKAELDEPFRAIRHYCLSEDVAVPLAAAGCPIHFVPAKPSEDAFLAGLR